MVARLSTHADGITVFNIRNLKGWNTAITGGDIASAVMDAQDIANDLGVPLYIPNQTPGTGPYASLNLPFNSTITLPAGSSLITEANEPMHYTGTATEAGLICGDENVQTAENILRVWVKRVTVDWSDEDICGIRLINFFRTKDCLLSAERFTIGLQILGSGTLGFSYNQAINLRLLRDNKIQMDLQRKKNTTGGAYDNTQGWVNSNTFIAGQFNISTGIYAELGSPSTTQPVGVRISQFDTNATYQINQNIWTGGTQIEIDRNFPLGCIPWLIECSAQQNLMEKFRFEAYSVTSVPFMKITAFSGVYKNEARSHYHNNNGALADASFVDDQGSGNYGNIFESQGRRIVTPFATAGPTTFEEFNKRATLYKRTGEILIPGWGWRQNGVNGNAMMDFSATKNISFDSSGYMVIPASTSEGPTKRFRTVNCKTVAINIDYVTSYSGRILVTVYDASGTRLGATYSGRVGSVTGPKYVNGEDWTWTGSWGGCFWSQANKYYSLIQLHDDVKQIEVTYVQSGVTECRVYGVNIYGTDGFLADITPAPHGLGERWAYQNPDDRTATATCSLSGDGIDTSFTITNAGGCYSSAPTISFSGGGGTGAAATCTVSALASGGEVLTITRTAAGSGYGSPPTMSFTSPTDKTQNMTRGQIIRNANFTGGSADIYGWVYKSGGGYDKVASAVV